MKLLNISLPLIFVTLLAPFAQATEFANLDKLSCFDDVSSTTYEILLETAHSHLNATVQATDREGSVVKYGEWMVQTNDDRTSPFLSVYSFTAGVGWPLFQLQIDPEVKSNGNGGGTYIDSADSRALDCAMAAKF